MVSNKAVYRRRRLVVAVIGVLGIGAGALGIGFVSARLSDPGPASTELGAPSEALAQSQPSDTPGALEGYAGRVDSAWAAQLAVQTGIPLRALQAYAGVAIVKHEENPNCHLGWNTLAAIGNVESRHGSYSGSTIVSNGQVEPPIFGAALDGNEVNRISDSDDGAIDGDAQWDRAVGPMQMIPQTWRNWGTDGNGDGVVDPQNMDDATLAAANYLCRAGGDLSVPENWKRAIAAYNDALPYARSVAEAAIRYATDAAG